MRFLLRLLVSALGVYLVPLILLALFQRSLIFRPALPAEGDPARYGVAFRDLRIPVRGAESIHGWWIEQKSPQQHPYFLYCHGNGGSLALLDQVAALFSEYGWNVLLFDYRGYGSSDAPSEGLSEESVALDTRIAYEWVLSQAKKEDRMLVWGHSLGSSICARAASEHHPAGVILEGAFPSMHAMSQVRYPWLWIPKFLVRDPFATVDYVKNLNTNLLMLHAERDVIVPFELGKRVYADAPEPKQWINLGAVGHQDFPSIEKKFRASIFQFVEDSLSLRNGSLHQGQNSNLIHNSFETGSFQR